MGRGDGPIPTTWWLPYAELAGLVGGRDPPMGVFVVTISFPSALCGRRVPLLVDAVPAGGERAPGVVFSPLLLLRCVFLLGLAKLSLCYLMDSCGDSRGAPWVAILQVSFL